MTTNFVIEILEETETTLVACVIFKLLKVNFTQEQDCLLSVFLDSAFDPPGSPCCAPHRENSLAAPLLYLAKNGR